MLILDDTGLPERTGRLEIARRAGRRRIVCAIHDVDGTHSLIREWPPVMSVLLHHVIAEGLPEDLDRTDRRARLIARAGACALPETDRFCVESAGMSALTQMEWAIRRGIEEGSIALAGGPLSAGEAAANSEVVGRIWAGEEVFGDIEEPARLRACVEQWAPRLFRWYEALLNEASRDRNLALARREPGAWRVPGSLEFLARLREAGARNYFVTGAVLAESGPPTGMLEELEAIGVEVGPGKLVEAALGSRWDEKMPKIKIIGNLLAELDAKAGSALIVGDGRSEVRAGVGLGAAVLSRLPEDAARQRALHRALGTNYLVPDYTEPALARLLRRER